MRKLLVSALLIAGTSAAAFAADLPLRSPPPAPFVPLPVFTWSGAYFGINAGYAFDYNSRFRTFDNPAGGNTGVADGLIPGSVGVSSDGFTAGGQIGYNYQFGAGNGIVVGVEADAAYTDLGQTNSYSNTALGVTRQTYFHSDMDFLGTVRGRVGYAFDRFLVYGTGGFAYGDVNVRSSVYNANSSVLRFSGSRGDIQTGYTYGGGVEFAVPTDSFLNSLNFFHSSAVTIKAEYLHYDLGGQNLTLNNNPGVTTGLYTQRIRTDGDLARIGINYKF